MTGRLPRRLAAAAVGAAVGVAGLAAVGATVGTFLPLWHGLIAFGQAGAVAAAVGARRGGTVWGAVTLPVFVLGADGLLDVAYGAAVGLAACEATAALGLAPPAASPPADAPPAAG